MLTHTAHTSDSNPYPTPHPNPNPYPPATTATKTYPTADPANTPNSEASPSSAQAQASSPAHDQATASASTQKRQALPPSAYAMLPRQAPPHAARVENTHNSASWHREPRRAEPSQPQPHPSYTHRHAVSLRMPYLIPRRSKNGRCDCGAETPNLGSTKCPNCRSFVARIGQMHRHQRTEPIERKPCRKCGLALSIKNRRLCLTCYRREEADRYRARDGRRRAAKRATNLTPADIRLQMKRTYCPLCRRRMTDEPDLPLTKHHDHIIPINIGGTHTWENTRVICRDCNLKRPKDGSDVAGQVALWQAEPAFAPRQPKIKAHKPPRERMHCMPPAPCACGCGEHTRYTRYRIAGYIKGHHHRGRLRGSKYDHLYPTITSLLAQGHRSKRIASELGISRDTARSIMERIERISEREIPHA